MTNSLLGSILPKLQRGDAPDSQWPDAKGEYHALCPFHNDEHAGNFSASERGYHCFVCDAKGGLKALAERLGASEQAQDDGLTLQAYAEAKKLPLEFLRGLGLTDGPYYWPEARRRIVATFMPYRDEAGLTTKTRVRLFLRKAEKGRDNRFRWAGKGGLSLYGLWRLAAIRKAGRVLLVEGESDAHTAWLHDVPCLGVPGARNFSATMAQSLRGLDVYVWREPDDAGAAFAAKVGELVPGARVVIPPDGVKDLSVAHIKGLDVRALWDNLMASAQPIVSPRAGASAGIEAKTLADLAPWVREQLSMGTHRDTKLTVAEVLADWLIERKRLIVDMGQDASRGGRPYIASEDGALQPLEPKSVTTRQILHGAGLNAAEETYKFVVEHLQMVAFSSGTKATLARWQEARNGALYVSCGPCSIVRARDGQLECVPNGTDDTFFAGDLCYPEWKPTGPVCPLDLAAFQPSLAAPSEVPTYTAEVQRNLLAVWLAALASGLRPLPLLLPFGQKGGGKSMTGKAAMRLFLGPTANLTNLTQDVKDFWTGLTTDPIYGIDNVDANLPVWAPDQLAAAVTGFNIQKRGLYTDNDKFSRPATAAIIVTTRTASFMRPDLAERTLVLTTQEFTDDNRKADADLLAKVDANRDALLSWCALTAAELLLNRHKAPGGLPLRFVDFARLVWAYYRMQGKAECAAAALVSLRHAQSLTVGEADPLVEAIVTRLDKFAVSGYWRGNASQLVASLTGAGADLPYLGGGKRIARQLREAKAALKLLGFELTEEEVGKNTFFTIHHVDQNGESGENGESDTSSGKNDSYQSCGEKVSEDSPDSPDSPSTGYLSDGDMYYVNLAEQGAN